MSTLFRPPLNVYPWDLFLSLRGWEGLADVLPKGWKDYLDNGACPE